MDAAGIGTLARDVFVLGGEPTVMPGPRGALGRIWRVNVGTAAYAVKEIFDEPPSEDSIAAELVLGSVAASAGARVPGCRPDRSGRYLATTPDRTWVRCYEWVDLHPVAEEPDTPRRLGRLVARMHRGAPILSSEPNGGGPADPWFDRLPGEGEWAVVTASAADLRERCASALSLAETVRPVSPARLRMCHRDLHPQNLFRDDAGGTVIVDWDDVGPAEPGRELARIAFDWFCDHETADIGAMRALYETYLAEGGPGRIAVPADFSMLLACRLNFVLEQFRVASDPTVDRHRRERARTELTEMCRIMPTAEQIGIVLELAVECNRSFDG